jgi:hypothetical protein
MQFMDDCGVGQEHQGPTSDEVGMPIQAASLESHQEPSDECLVFDRVAG